MKQLEISEKEQRIIDNASPELYAIDIAVNANVSLQSVYRAVRKFNLQIKKFKNDLTDEQKDIIRSMASPQTGVKAIRDVIGCTRFQIECFLDEEGLPRKRSKSLHKEIPMGRNGVFNVDSVGKHYTWLV